MLHDAVKSDDGLPAAPEGLPDFSELARLLEIHPDFRVLRRMEPLARYSDPTDNLGSGLLVDTETTGLRSDGDKIIELAMVPFTFDKSTGAICDVSDGYEGFEDPGFPLSPEVIELTGITDDMVQGRQFDNAAVAALASVADIVVAHNAGFDRPFMEARFPVFESKAWGCSQRDVQWARHGFRAQKLEWLLDRGHHVFYDAHRADSDCRATIHLLATPLASGMLPFSELLDSARERRVLVWAFGAPFEQKGALGARGYRWFPGDNQFKKAWRREVPVDRVADEMEWLENSVYRGNGVQQVKCSDASARVRYSNRVGRWRSGIAGAD